MHIRVLYPEEKECSQKEKFPAFKSYNSFLEGNRYNNMTQASTLNVYQLRWSLIK